MPEQDPPEDEITLEEWIAASQSCCGGEPESRRKPTPTPDAGATLGPPADAVQSGDAPPTP